MMRFINIVPYFPDHLEYTVQECRQVRSRTGLVEAALCLTLHPEGMPAMEKARRYAGDFGRLRELLRPEGIELGVLLQSLIGHGWDGQPDTGELFQRTVNHLGRSSRRFCPLDPGFQAYVAATVTLLASQRPAFFLVDDDFRLIDNNKLECFCPLHRARMAQPMEQQELIDRIVAARPGEALLEEFEQVRRSSLLELADVVRQAIDGVDPQIRCGYCMPGREHLICAELTKRLAGGTKPFVRVGNALYMEGDPKDFLLRMYQSQILIRACDGIPEILDEADTWPQHRYSKSAVAMHAHISCGILHGLNGAKLWLTNVFQPDAETGLAYERMLGSHRGFYRELRRMTEDIRYLGAATPLADIRKNFHPLHYPEYFTWPEWQSRLLNRYGIPGSFIAAGEEAGCRMLAGNMPDYFDDATLLRFLGAGLLLDGAAAAKLHQRGFGEYLGVEPETKPFRFIFDRIRASWERLLLLNDGSVRFLHIRSPEVEVMSELIDAPHCQSEEVSVAAPGSTVFANSLGGRVAVYAAELGMPVHNWLSPGHKKLLLQILNRLEPLPLYCLDDQDMYLRFGRLAAGGYLLSVVNFNFDRLEKALFRCRVPVRTVERLEPDGNWAAVEFTGDGEQLEIGGDFSIYRVNIFRLG